MPKAGWKKDFDAFQLKETKKKESTAPPKTKTKAPKKKMDDLILGIDTSPQLKFAKPQKAPKKTPKPLKRSPLPPPTKPLAQMGKKRKERILTEGSETDMNREIWNTRPHWCECCGVIIEKALEPFRWIENAKGERVQKLIRPECFAHKLAKGKYPQHRLKPDNIALVCSRACHAQIDIEYGDLETRRLLDEELNLIS